MHLLLAATFVKSGEKTSDGIHSVLIEIKSVFKIKGFRPSAEAPD